MHVIAVRVPSLLMAVTTVTPSNWIIAASVGLRRIGVSGLEDHDRQSQQESEHDSAKKRLAHTETSLVEEGTLRHHANLEGPQSPKSGIRLTARWISATAESPRTPV
jgi:hypothetical protein